MLQLEVRTNVRTRFVILIQDRQCCDKIDKGTIAFKIRMINDVCIRTIITRKLERQHYMSKSQILIIKNGVVDKDTSLALLNR